MNNARLIVSALAAMACAVLVTACDNNPNTLREDQIAQPAPEAVVDKAAELIENIANLPQEDREALEKSPQLIIQVGGKGIYNLGGEFLGPVKGTWCDSTGVCYSDTQADNRFQTEIAPLQSKEELTSFLAPGEVAIGNCAPVGGTMCAAAGNYTVGGQDYTGRISCNLVRLDGKAYMRAYAVPCEEGQCEMTGQYPVFGLCFTCQSVEDCDDGNFCTTDSCAGVAGCQYTYNTLPCPDGTVCNGNEVCNGGLCRAGTNLTCDDGNICTNDSCNPASGCQYTNNSAPCSDGNVCTLNEACSGGSCVSGTSADCDDGNVCTSDACAAAEGCKYTPVADTVPCNDGNACTLETACQASICVASSTKSCSDANPCTRDLCDPASGACSNPSEIDGTDCPGSANQCVGGTCVADTLVCSEPGKLDCSANVVSGQNAHVECVFKPGGTKGTWTVKATCGPINNSTCAPITGCGTGTPSEVACADGLDNDSDGATDCADANCVGTSSCQACANTAACNDGNACTTDACVAGFCQRTTVTCAGGATCVPATGCPSQPCTPQCTGKQCGNDGCGGTCGTCASGFSCDATGQCQNAPAADEFQAVWLKPSNGVPSNIATFVIAVECKEGSQTHIDFHYLFNDPASVKFPASATSLSYTKVVPDLLGSTCKGNVFGYDSAGNSTGWYAVMDSGLTKSGTWSYHFNSVNVTNTGVGTNNQGGGDFVFYPGTPTTGDDDGDSKPNATDPDDTDASK